MSITKQQAMKANEFHCGDCTRRVGPRGGITVSSEVWRRNGATKTWTTRPNDFNVPVKYGLRDYFTVTQYAEGWHVAADCPLLVFAELPQAVAKQKHPPTPQHECAGGCGRMIGMHVAQCWRCRTRTAEARVL